MEEDQLCPTYPVEYDGELDVAVQELRKDRQAVLLSSQYFLTNQTVLKNYHLLYLLYSSEYFVTGCD